MTVNGLPSGASASVTITGPGGYTSNIAHSSTLANLAPGNYQLTAADGGARTTRTTFPSPSTATLAVAAGADPASTTVVYSKTISTLDLTIGAMYLTQTTQTLSGAVPLVQNRDGYLRVFVVANQSNSAAPQVRVRFYVNGTQQGSPVTIAAPSHSLPASVNQGDLAKLMELRRARLDDQTRPLDSRRRRPVARGGRVAARQQQLPRVGNAAGAHSQEFVDLLHPIRSGEAERQRPHGKRLDCKQGCVAREDGEDPSDLRLRRGRSRHLSPTNAAALTGGNGNGAWEAILGEMQALRVAEGSLRNYFGIVKTSYTSGIAGISYIGGGASVGYDGASETEIISHELGHSWGRSHAPCGISGNTDPNYPYSRGNIGVYGMDVATATLYPPSTAEVMSYCHPQWISDYTYTGVYNWRSGHPSAPDFVHADLQPCIIVWGRIVGRARRARAVVPGAHAFVAPD